MKDVLQKNVLIAIDQLLAVAEFKNPGGDNIDNGIGEVEIKGVEYQVQVSFISDKTIWAKEGHIRFSEVVKVHK